MSWGKGTAVRVLCGLGVMLIVLGPVRAAASEDDEPLWAVTGWAHWGTNGDITAVPGIDSDFENSWIGGLSLARQFARTGEDFTWEFEAGVY